ncbi:hypothetical protein VNO77_32115 [Canavalia gladiata]|uniref:AMP-dependent synthetase/ligase domain-containing protein n=1 Tax=Canavalia gladiata TaxID=3824 RepID=A0AAN9Q233_CANGL
MDSLSKYEANYTPLTPLSFLTRAAKCYANRTSVILEANRFTWKQTHDRCRRLASSLRALNIARNDVVSVLAPNIPAMYEMHFAVPMAGAVLNTINTRLDANNLATILKHSEAKVLFVDYEYVPQAKEALKLLMGQQEDGAAQKAHSSLPLLILIDDINAPTNIKFGEFEYEQLVQNGDPNLGPEQVHDEWDPITLNYTSGTTSAPKGVVYSHRGAYLSTLSIILGWEMGTEPVYLWTLPMFHCNGWAFTWGVAARGGTNVCLRNTAAKPIFENISLHHVTHMCCAPIVFNIILEAKPNEVIEIKSPVKILMGGAPPLPTLLDKMGSLGFEITHAYGITEATGSVLNWYEDKKEEKWSGLGFKTAKEDEVWLEKCYVGQVNVEVNREGVFTVKVIPIGGRFGIAETIRGRGYPASLVEELKQFLDNWMFNREWSAMTVSENQVIWIRCQGMTLQAWNREFFEFIVRTMDMCISVDP